MIDYIVVDEMRVDENVTDDRLGTIKSILKTACSSMKVTTTREYLYIDRTGVRIYSITPNSVKCAILPQEATELLVNMNYTDMIWETNDILGKPDTKVDMYLIECRHFNLFNPTLTFDSQDFNKLGWISNRNETALYDTISKITHIRQSVCLYEKFKYDPSLKYVRYESINKTNDEFYNMMTTPSRQGAVKVKIDDIHTMIIAPCMLPISKSSTVDLEIIHVDNVNYYVAVFTVPTNSKKKYTTETMMQFLYV